VAIDLAARINGGEPQARGLIVEATFTSLADIAAEMTFRWLPTSLLLRQKFDSIAKIKTVALPVLVVHGVNDRFVPARFSEALYAAAPDPKKLLLIENGSHNNSMWMGDAAYQQALSELFGLFGARDTDSSVTSRAPRL
jgi:fermentation-respiration switch protein FrsA (DUF1100 family)